MKRLVALPFNKAFEIALKSIRVRFFRSLITTMSLVLAVAFLAFTQASDDVAQSVLTQGDPAGVGQLVKLGYDISPGDTSIATSAKQRWIVFLSLLVCVVGIVNAQLMSVTERFREIGTMKCLGALDRFVVRIFLIEAALQGVVGSLCGAMLGIFFAITAGIYRFGLGSLPISTLGDCLSSFVLAMGTGTVLSLMGALYPALLAAKMQPVEAMRVEQ